MLIKLSYFYSVPCRVNNLYNNGKVCVCMCNSVYLTCFESDSVSQLFKSDYDAVKTKVRLFIEYVKTSTPLNQCIYPLMSLSSLNCLCPTFAVAGVSSWIFMESWVFLKMKTNSKMKMTSIKKDNLKK